jgi:TPR repeat protein
LVEHTTENRGVAGSNPALATRLDPEERATLIRLALLRLSELNGGHRFEQLCFAFARRRLEADLLPASGPVGAGGDRGRDFEGFGDSATVGICTTQQGGIPQKIRTDVAKAVERGRSVARVLVFLTASLAVPRRESLREELGAEHGIELEIFDGNALAQELASRDLLDLAEMHLKLPLLRQLAAESPPLDLGLAAGIDPGAVRPDRPPATVALRVEREAEEELREAFGRALGAGGSSLVLVEGERCSGRSHVCAQALGAVAPKLPVHLARTAEQLWTWLGAMHTEPAALLLDPFERIVEEGGGALIEAVRGGDGWRPPLLLVGIAMPPALEVADVPRPVADAVVEVDTLLGSRELERAREPLEYAGLFDQVRQWGLGPVLVAGPQLADRYRRAAAATGAAAEGRRLVEAIVGWHQAGFREELEGEILRDLVAALRNGGTERTWEQATAWALEEVQPGQSCANFAGDGWSCHPALLGLPLSRGWEARWREGAAWARLEAWAGDNPGRLASLGTAALRLGCADTAASVLEGAVARGSSRASFNLALLHLRKGSKGKGPAWTLLTDLRRQLAGSPEDPAARQAHAATLRTLGLLELQDDSAAAAETFREAALLGDTEAIVNLAQLERSQDRADDGRRMLWAAADRGSVVAVAALLLEFDATFDRAVENLDAAGMEALGALLLRRGERTDAERAFAAAASAGRLPAQAQLGGLLLERDRGRAVELLEVAVARGSRAATEYLARALRESEPARARRLMRRAWELGSPTAEPDA